MKKKSNFIMKDKDNNITKIKKRGNYINNNIIIIRKIILLFKKNLKFN